MSTEERPRLVCFRPQGFINFLKSLSQSYGTAGAAMVYEMSRNYGKYLLEFNMKQVPKDPSSAERVFLSLLDRIKDLGWGTFTIERLDREKGEGEILLENQVFHEFCTDPGNEVQCHFFRGSISGTLSAYLKREIYVKDFECRGDKKWGCYFEFGPK